MFKHHETIHAKAIQNLNLEDFPEYKFLRLILWTLKVEKKWEKLFLQDKNFSYIPFIKNSTQSLKILKNAIHPNKLSSLESYLQKSKAKNYSLHLEILAEANYFFSAQSNRQHLQGFIHLWRIIEFTSFMLPLVHAWNSKNYTWTFNELKKYFRNGDNEISFASNFTKNLLKDDSVLEIELEIPISDKDIYEYLKSALNKDYITYDDIGREMRVKHKDILILIYDIRNRYFHFSSWNTDNFSTERIKDPNLFFSYFNDWFINWISYIYIHILNQQIDNWT
jgi:hypothetical protein